MMDIFDPLSKWTYSEIAYMSKGMFREPMPTYANEEYNKQRGARSFDIDFVVQGQRG